MFDFEAKLKTLPEKPGVYIMHGADGQVIYVGKAKVLKNRVRQYFKNHNHPPKVKAMVESVASFEYIISDSELEALVLENNLIKKYMPKYNILLKDDKTYPFLKVTLNEDYPRIFVTRQVKKDGAKYFGPYQSGIVLRDLIELVREIFMLRCCNKPFSGDFEPQRPCLYYQLGKCSGVCAHLVSKDEYRAVIAKACSFLSGKYDDVYKNLTAQMNEAAENLDFEKAALLRDRIKSVEMLGKKQKIVTANGTDIDAVAMYSANDITCAEIFFIRSGNMIGKEHYFIPDTDGMEQSKILSDFLRAYYADSSFIPRELYLQYEIEDESAVREWLSSLAGRSVAVKCPKIGEHARLISMIESNARKEHSEYELKRMRAADFVNNALSQLTQLLGFENPPMLIEAYDISNTSGDCTVGSMVTFRDGKSFRGGYRNFKIKNIVGQNDYAAMQEMITRRFSHALEEKAKIMSGIMKEEDAKFLPMPDVVFADGGKGHVDAVVEALDKLNIGVPVFGIVKDDNHNTRGLVSLCGEIAVDSGSDAFMLLTNIQDEMHRRAITYHRNLRSAKSVKSELLSVPGVGNARRKALLAHFKSVSAIKKATVDELAAAKGIDARTAENIYKFFHGGEE